MAKSADAFRTISEVAEWLEVPAHVLRFWESKFSQIKPVKRAGGRRYYRPADMLLLGGIKALLHDEGMTIKGAQKLLREQGVRHVSDLSQPLDEVTKGEASNIALDVAPERSEPAKVLNFERGGNAPPAVPAPAPPEILDAPEDQTAATAEAEDTASPAETDSPIPQDARLPDETPPHALDDANHDTTDTGSEQQPEDLPPQVTDPDREIIAETAPPEPEAQAATEPAAEPEPEPEAAALKEPTPLPQPDLPEDATDKVSADPGPLAALADLPHPISPETAARLGPVLARLSALGAAKSQDGQLRD
ncbi:MerR HTH family regulatory protein [Roseovarius lutimaris]|uniref:MerR HTH family regulatory protein n=1 Tax=Roseovarius lutimaris TaxID=1005928 RepID=A0A1I5BPZ4_9RHOB|nr:MerR family transcriptional regulator [Roseovarius lutimaris]SFN76758.1 MerR HTH family regulatory protein [Roseovarius lutimaris]